MLKVFVALILTLGGLGWAALAAFGAGMASRPTTFWENTGRPLLGVIPILLGIAILIFG
jgi:hypothetical protein